MIDRTALPVTLDLARTLAWIANAAGGWLDHDKAIEFVRGLAQPGEEAMLIVTGERLKGLDPKDVRDERIYVLGREQTVSVRGSEAARHWAHAWTELQKAGRRSTLSIHGRPHGRPGARMEIIPAAEFGQLVLMQGDDGGSRLASRAARDDFWDKIEVLFDDVLRLWPVDVANDDAPMPASKTASAPLYLPRKRGPRPELRLAVEQAMRDAVRDGLKLEDEKEDALASRFGASRATCRDARNNVLAELDSDNHRQTSSNDK